MLNQTIKNFRRFAVVTAMTSGSFVMLSATSVSALKNNVCLASEVCWFSGLTVAGNACVYDNDNGTDSSLSSGTSRFFANPCDAVLTDNTFDNVWNRYGVGNYVQGFENDSNGGANLTGAGTCVGPGIFANLNPVNAASSHRPRTLVQCV
jgi:hypothetical protein